MYVLDDVCFICHPNTGSRSLAKGLKEAGASQIGGHHNICTKTLAGTRACVCVIRNPYEIMASWYFKKRKPGEFHDWVANLLQGKRNFQGPQPSGLFYGLIWATHVVKFEEIPDGLNNVTDILELPRLEFGQVAYSGRTPEYHLSFYKEDDKAKFLIRRAFEYQIRVGRYKCTC